MSVICSQAQRPSPRKASCWSTTCNLTPRPSLEMRHIDTWLACSISKNDVFAWIQKKQVSICTRGPSVKNSHIEACLGFLYSKAVLSMTHTVKVSTVGLRLAFRAPKHDDFCLATKSKRPLVRQRGLQSKTSHIEHAFVFIGKNQSYKWHRRCQGCLLSGYGIQSVVIIYSHDLDGMCHLQGCFCLLLKSSHHQHGCFCFLTVGTFDHIDTCFWCPNQDVVFGIRKASRFSTWLFWGRVSATQMPLPTEHMWCEISLLTDSFVVQRILYQLNMCGVRYPYWRISL
jgi:hypothetical protein